jgi:hypothetical protein
MTNTQVMTAQPDPPRWKALALRCFAAFMVILAQIEILALPSIEADLGLSAASAQWALCALCVPKLGFPCKPDSEGPVGFWHPTGTKEAPIRAPLRIVCAQRRWANGERPRPPNKLPELQPSPSDPGGRGSFLFAKQAREDKRSPGGRHPRAWDLPVRVAAPA